MNDLLKENLDLIKQNIKEANLDWVMVIEGDEGSGKTTLALQIAKEIQPDFTATQVAYSYLDVMKILDNLKDDSAGKVVVLDEGAETLFRGDFQKKDVKEMMKLFFRIRKKKLFFIICIPSALDLVKTLTKRRVKTIVKCVFTWDKRGILRQGNFQAFDYEKVKEVMNKGKYPKPTFSGHFTLEDLDKKLWDETQKKNYEFLNATHNRRMIALEIKHALDLKILNSLRTLLGADNSKRLITKQVSDELIRVYAYPTDWMTPLFVSKRMKRMGFTVEPDSATGYKRTIVTLEALNKIEEAIKTEIEDLADQENPTY